MNDEEMIIESNRLATFANWPVWLPVEPSRIAAAGFYATGSPFEVRCPWCKSSFWKWGHENVSVIARHCFLDPVCPFVVNPTTCGNIPITIAYDQMNEQCRFQTFVNWRNTYVSPIALATAGFYYYNQSDRVRCSWCHSVMGQWEEGDEPFHEHDKNFPNCPRVVLGPNITYRAIDGIRKLGIQPKIIPSREKYSHLHWRIRTFSDWPQRDIQSPEALATAGFYYSDIDDQVKCFHCNGGLQLWEKEDDPWYEHAKWFPRCQFVILAKGPKFVKTIEFQMKPNSLEARIRRRLRKAVELSFPEERISTENSQQSDSENYEEATDNVPENSNQNTNGTTKERKEESKTLLEIPLCKICWVNKPNVVFKPCGHLVACFQCVSTATASTVSTCYLCRQSVQKYFKIFSH